jgi:hypothetical protein
MSTAYVGWTALRPRTVVLIWLAEHGLVDFAVQLREEFLTGTAITIIVALLVLLVPARSAGSGIV